LLHKANTLLGRPARSLNRPNNATWLKERGMGCREIIEKFLFSHRRRFCWYGAQDPRAAMVLVSMAFSALAAITARMSPL